MNKINFSYNFWNYILKWLPISNGMKMNKNTDIISIFVGKIILQRRIMADAASKLFEFFFGTHFAC